MPLAGGAAYAWRVSALYAWLRRHPRLVDGVLATVLALIGSLPEAAAGVWLWVPLALALSVPLAFRRAYPVSSFVAAILVGAVQVLTGLRLGISDAAIVVLLYTLAAYKPRRISVTGLAVCLAGSLTAVLHWAPPSHIGMATWFVFGAVAMAAPSLIAWVVGDSMRYRRAYYASLEDRAARLEAERDAQAQIAAAAERARIARELHDVIAHNVSVMVVQADGASFAIATDPERAAQALAAISATGRQALSEMRRLLGILRRDSGRAGPERAPVPGMGQVGELLDQARAAGLPVSFAVEGVPRALPDGPALAAYRVVQESLTNIRKHAGPAATACVTLRYTEDALTLEITDDGRGAATAPDGAGHGLPGMAERLAMYGGSVDAGPVPGGGFGVRATLPALPAAQAGAA
jgi:signal transduction histidine kinase